MIELTIYDATLVCIALLSTGVCLGACILALFYNSKDAQ